MGPIHLRQLLLVWTCGWMCALSLPHLKLVQNEELTGKAQSHSLSSGFYNVSNLPRQQLPTIEDVKHFLDDKFRMNSSSRPIDDRERAALLDVKKRFRDNDVVAPVIGVPAVRRVGTLIPFELAHHVSNLTCIACKAMVTMLRDMSRQNQTEDAIINATIKLCIARKIQDPRVCQMVVPQYSEIALGVVRKTLLLPDELCGILLGSDCATPPNPGKWNITISNKPKPPVAPHVRPQPGTPVIRVLHLTDLHLDRQYLAGADSDCGEPLCCRNTDTYPAPSPSKAGGTWGDYRSCDSPWQTVENLFRLLADIKDQFDYIVFTGDIPAHDVWNQTRTGQLTSLLQLAGFFRRYLPDKPVYTCMGNHESVPCNSYPPDSVEGQSMSWLYSAVLEAWGYWLPSSTYQTILRGGFYTFSPFPGFRIVSLNSNYGASANWWLLINSTDPQGQLQWLADVLQEAEDKGEKVHILSHIPPGELMHDFSWNYYKLINRYESTITGQFHGHTHKDEYQVFYDLSNRTRPVGVSFVGGSVTPYSFTNPGFRIYTIDGNHTNSSWAVLDYTHSFLNLSHANEYGNPVWETEYSPMRDYQMKGLYPEDWHELIYRMKANDTLFQTFYKYYFKSAKTDSCTGDCKRGFLCALKSARPDDPELCEDL